MFRFRILAAVACCSLTAVAQSQPPKPQIQKRDLKIEEIDPDSPAPNRKAAPRSWAVIIGIAAYPKLPADRQLLFPERDAQSINTILISKEGGNFKAENTHMLTGSKATL